MPAFEFDHAKSVSNLGRHGIDFEEAKALWNDPELIEVPAKTDDEPRCLLIGRLRGKHWAAVVTHRGDRIRLISVRRARPEEVVLYEGQGF
jgi:uncharacterized DUF497 family protein